MAASAPLAAIVLIHRPDVAVDVVDARTDRVLWRRIVAPGAHVELRYTHSVERTPVTEEFRAERTGLRLVGMRFVSQGAGLPTEGYTREGDQFVLRTDRRIGTVPLRVSRIVAHRLRVGTDEADLIELAGDGAAIGLTSGPGPWRVRWPWMSRGP